MFNHKTLLFGLILLFTVSGVHTAGDDSGQLNSLLAKMNSLQSFRANITINNSTTGKLSWKSPNLLHIKLSDGRIISANGRFLWFYSPRSAITGKQDLDGSTGGLSGLLSGYENVTVTGNTILLKSNSRFYEEITVIVDANHMLKAIRMKNRDQKYTNLAFSDIQINVGLASNLFNLHPPSNSQMIENPLNEKE